MKRSTWQEFSRVYPNDELNTVMRENYEEFLG
jgi:hypothetical protein